MLANTNPSFYQTDVDDASSPSGRRRLVYATNDDLVIGQVEHGTDKILSVPKTSNLTIYAKTVTISGVLAVAGGHVKVVCRKLRVVSGAPTSIVVSPELEKEYRVPGTAPPRSTAGSPGKKASNGADLAKTKSGKYGQSGRAAGTIELVCDDLELGDKLVLDASGGPGYPGHDGQDGADGKEGDQGSTRQEMFSPGHGVAFRDVVVTPATEGYPGQEGGDAMKGGDGGAAGTVVFRCSTAKIDTTKLIIKVDAGAPGAAGKAGKGGVWGRGGKMHYHPLQGSSSVRNQEHPRDGEETPVVDGAAAPAAAHGKGGRRRFAKRANDLAAIGEASDGMFFAMMYQSLRFRFIDCSPQMFHGAELQFPKGSADEWKALAADVDWMARALRNVDKNEEDPELGRKTNCYALVVALQTQQTNRLTVFDKAAPWVPRASFESLRTEFDTCANAAAKFEEKFFKLADDYENKNVARLDAKDHAEMLHAESRAYLEAYDESKARLADAFKAIRKATTRLDAASEALLHTREELVRALSGFHCNLETILQAAEMMAFCHGSAPMAMGMGAVQAFKVISDGVNKIPTTDGGSIDSKFFIHSLRDVGDKLKEGMTTALADSSGEVGDSKAPAYLARLDKFDEMIDQVRGPAGSAGVAFQAAVQEYRNALVERSEAIIEYNSEILLAVQFYRSYEADEAELTAIGNGKQIVDPYDLQTFAGYARRYQQKVEAVLEILDMLERKRAFLTLGGPVGDDKMAVERNKWLSLWYGGARTEHKVDDFLSEVDEIARKLATDYSKAGSPMSPFPDESDGAIRLSYIKVRLPAAMVEQLKSKGEVTFVLVPEGQATRPDEVEVADTAKKCDLRISNVRPHVIGASTRGGALEIGIVCEGETRIDDPSGTVYRFEHDRVDTSFVHFTSFVEPADAHYVYEPVRSGQEGKISDAVLDLVGLFGKWTLWIQKSEKHDDPNFDYEPSGIRDVLIYFKGYFRDRPRTGP